MLDGLVGHIDKCLDAYEDFGRRTRWEAQPGSPFEYETGRLRRHIGPGRHWNGTEANRAAVISTLFTQQAAEHLEAVQSLIKERQVTFSIAPLTRSIVELCGHVYWLLDPSLMDNPRGRAARVFLAELDDATKRASAAKAFEHPDTEQIVKFKKALRQEVLPVLFYPSEIEFDERSGALVRLCKQSKPGLSASLRFIENAIAQDVVTPGMYGYLSNATHPTPYIVEEVYRWDEAQGRGYFVLPEARNPYALTRLAVVAFTLMWQVIAAYRGLDQQEAVDLAIEIDTLPSPPPE